MPNAPKVYIVIIPRSLTTKKIIMLDAVEVADMEPLKAI